MTEALGLEGGERILEIGAGSGYAATVLSEIAGEVHKGLQVRDDVADPDRTEIRALSDDR